MAALSRVLLCAARIHFLHGKHSHQVGAVRIQGRPRRAWRAARQCSRPGTRPSTPGAICTRSTAPRRCTSPAPSPAAGRPNSSEQARALRDGPVPPPGRSRIATSTARSKAFAEPTLTQLEFYCQGVNDGLLRRRPYAADVGHRFSAAAVGSVVGAADRQPAELCRSLDRRAGKRAADTGIDSARHRRRAAPRVVSSLLGRRRLRAAARDSHRQATLRRCARAARRLAAARGQQRLGGEPGAQRDRARAAGVRSASGSESPAGDLVRSRAQLGRQGEYAMGATLPGCPIMAVGRTPRLAWGVTYMHADTSDFFIEDCRPGGATGWQYRRGDSVVRLSASPGSRFSGKGAPPTLLDVYENEQGTLTHTPPTKVRESISTVTWIGERIGGGRSIGTWLDVIASPSAAEAMDIVSVARIRRWCGCLPTARATSARRRAAGFRSAAAATRGSCRCRLGIGRTTGRAACAPTCCRASTIRRAASWPPRTRNSIGRRAAAPRPWCPTIASGGSSSGSPTCRRPRSKDMQALQYDVLSTQARELLPVLLALVDDGPAEARSCRSGIAATRPRAPRRRSFSISTATWCWRSFGHEEGIGWRRMLYLCTRMGFSTMSVRLLAVDRTFFDVPSVRRS